MDYLRMTAPCGLDCFNCHFYLAHEDEKAMDIVRQLGKEHNVPVEAMLCKGCRNHGGKIPLHMYLYGEDHRCAAYECAKQKGHDLCGQCGDFPCDNLHPYADMAGDVPHNTKVFNLCLINRMGLDNWARSKAAEVRKDYFNKPWSLK